MKARVATGVGITRKLEVVIQTLKEGIKKVL
jgi:hypothetical protein